MLVETLQSFLKIGCIETISRISLRIASSRASLMASGLISIAKIISLHGSQVIKVRSIMIVKFYGIVNIHKNR